MNLSVLSIVLSILSSILVVASILLKRKEQK
jgi:hypothetical protein